MTLNVVLGTDLLEYRLIDDPCRAWPVHPRQESLAPLPDGRGYFSGFLGQRALLQRGEGPTGSTNSSRMLHIRVG
jgi:hypothetical protein